MMLRQGVGTFVRSSRASQEESVMRRLSWGQISTAVMIGADLQQVVQQVDVTKEGDVMDGAVTVLVD